MQYKKLTKEQREIKRWRERRNRKVTELLNADPFLSRAAALRQANKFMKRKRTNDT